MLIELKRPCISFGRWISLYFWHTFKDREFQSQKAVIETACLLNSLLIAKSPCIKYTKALIASFALGSCLTCEARSVATSGRVAEQPSSIGNSVETENHLKMPATVHRVICWGEEGWWCFRYVPFEKTVWEIRALHFINLRVWVVLQAYSKRSGKQVLRQLRIIIHAQEFPLPKHNQMVQCPVLTPLLIFKSKYLDIYWLGSRELQYSTQRPAADFKCPNATSFDIIGGSHLAAFPVILAQFQELIPLCWLKFQPS